MALIATGILAFGLWVHHMFAVGLPRLGNDFYTAASMSIALPILYFDGDTQRAMRMPGFANAWFCECLVLRLPFQ